MLWTQVRAVSEIRVGDDVTITRDGGKVIISRVGDPTTIYVDIYKSRVGINAPKSVAIEKTFSRNADREPKHHRILPPDGKIAGAVILFVMGFLAGCAPAGSAAPRRDSGAPGHQTAVDSLGRPVGSGLVRQPLRADEDCDCPKPRFRVQAVGTDLPGDWTMIEIVPIPMPSEPGIDSRDFDPLPIPTLNESE